MIHHDFDCLRIFFFFFSIGVACYRSVGGDPERAQPGV